MTAEWANRYEGYATLLLDRLKIFQGELETGPDEPSQLSAAAKICELCGNLTEAAQIYRALAENPNCEPQALARFALVQIKLGQPSEALQTAIRLVKSHKASIETLMGTPLAIRTVLGDALLACGQTDGALEAYRTALGEEARDRRAGSQVVQLLVEKGKLDEAREIGQQVEFEPGRTSLRAFLGLVLEDGATGPAFLAVQYGDFRAEHAV